MSRPSPPVPEKEQALTSEDVALRGKGTFKQFLALYGNPKAISLREERQAKPCSPTSRLAPMA